MFSQDLPIEPGRELADQFTHADELLLVFVDACNETFLKDLVTVLNTADVDESDHQLVIDFLHYYGVIGLRTSNRGQYIFSVTYDLKVMKIRALLSGDLVRCLL